MPRGSPTAHLPRMLLPGAFVVVLAIAIFRLRRLPSQRDADALIRVLRGA